MRGSVVLVTVVAALALLPAQGRAASYPTAVTVVRGDLDQGTFTTLVTLQPIRANRARVSAFRVDSIDGSEVHNDGELYSVVLGRGRCSSKGPAGRPLLRFTLGAGKLVELTRTLKASALRGGASWYVLEQGARKPEKCVRVGRFSPVGAIFSPRDSASGQATGLVALRRAARRVRVTQLLYDLGDTLTHEIFGASERPCGEAEAFTASDDLWQWRKEVTASFMDYTEDAWDFAATRSLALFDGRNPPGTLHMCDAWDEGLE